VSERPDLSHFVQHRQLDSYEQGMARRSYAYGVDLRRSRWLASSTVGNALVRAVDRAWPRLSAHLMEEALLEGDRVPVPLLREISEAMEILRAPLPTLRVLRPEQRGRWPVVTALGATQGGSLWLVLDIEALLALSKTQRAFLFATGLAHLHCEHAVFFSAHLLASRREGRLGMQGVRTLLKPWTKVMSFSADRAGLLCCDRLETAAELIANPPVPVGAGSSDSRDWLPVRASTELRLRALREFARSSVYAKVHAVRARQAELLRQASGPDSGPGSEPDPEASIHVPADAWSLARVDTRLTRRLGLL